MKDIFMRFWFNFIFPYKGELELGNLNFVQEKPNENFIDNHVSFVYEDICRSIFSELCKEINFIPSHIGSYWDKHKEIDVVAVDETHHRVFIGECKYFKEDKPIDVNIYAKLLEKSQIKEFSGYEIIYGLFSKSGFSDRLKEISKDNDKLVLFNGSHIV